jgi:GNAT superfamily N-acetyltransferase
MPEGGVYLEFIIGYDLEQFKRYYCSLNDLHRFYKSRKLAESTTSALGGAELSHIKRNPTHLIVWKQGDETVGHTIWHETSTDEMIPGDPRDEEDRRALHNLFNGEKDNLVELHEVWLRTEKRGRGYGSRFFEFFEGFAAKRGFDGIVYYTDNPSAIALCRKRGYREAPEPLEGEGFYIFVHLLGKQ